MLQIDSTPENRTRELGIPTRPKEGDAESSGSVNLWQRGLVLGKKVTALGFIIVILAGNFWLIEYIFLQRTAAAVEWTFFAGFSLAIFGGLAMMGCAMAGYLKDFFFTK